MVLPAFEPIRLLKVALRSRCFGRSVTEERLAPLPEDELQAWEGKYSDDPDKPDP